MSAAADEIDEAAARRIRQAGWAVVNIVRHYPPYDSGEDATFLFMGRSLERWQEPHPLTAHVPDDPAAPVEVTEGW